MQLLLKRKRSVYGCTLGELAIDGKWECFTLEDPVRDGPKVDGDTAIPVGTYQVVIDQSIRFKRLMPHVLDVPGFAGIRIHSGNTSHDTEGCILVGQTSGVASVGDSRAAFAPLFEKLKAALTRGETITLTVQ